MTSPVAEIEVDERGVRSLLAAQHPDLVSLPLTRVDAGWDNTLWRLGDDLVVRLPRRQLAARLTVNEQRWLPQLAPQLPLPVPVPVHIGRATATFPWPWSIVRWLPGQPGDRAQLTEPEGSARALGRFLRALHHPAPVDAPENPFRGVPLGTRAPRFEELLAELGDSIDRHGAQRVWDGALGAAAWSRPPVWIHGDLHPANVLVERGALAAVIDFGDLCAGDPATDLAAGWMLLPAEAMSTFAASYGPIDPDLERRTLGWVVLFALMLISIGKDGRPTYAAVGQSALTRALDR